MQTITRTSFTTVKTEGGLLPADLLQRIADGREVKGLRPEDYHLLPSERLNEAINRAWNRCLGAWKNFDEQRQLLAENDTGTTLTRERWLLVLFQELGYGRLQTQRSSLTTADGTSYPISHLWENVAPIHLVTFRQPLDRRSEISTQVKRSPHSLMQEFLNRSPEYRWGIISNGLQLRLLRDNASLRRAAYVEFDFEAMMTGELYAEFSLLWLVCHQSRIEAHSEQGADEGKSAKQAAPTKRKSDDEEEDVGGAEEESAEATRTTCWLEEWSKQAVEQGTRALDALRVGVTEAIEALGRGFLQHRANANLHQRLRSGDLTTQEYYQQLRRLVYRLIFLFVAEDRDLLLLRDVAPAMRRRYQDYYSLHRLRALAAELRGSPHADLYQQLRLLFVLLREGYPALGLPALGSYLFSDRSTPDLDTLEIANRDLLTAIRALAFTVESGVLRAVDYRNLGTEELGSVYESLLELHPNLEVGSGSFALTSVAGSERKTTGSYYTPEALVNELLNSALEPVVADRLQGAEARRRKESKENDGARPPAGERSSATRQTPAEDALLSIKVLDFACGSGHMLIGAARRLALHLARIRSGDDEPGPDLIRNALRDVVRHCIYGVDLNATSVELCKVALWMETLEPGKPLGFLDANIRCGNSLLGVTSMEDLAEGVPDEAFTPKSGDDRATMAALKRRNKRERDGQLRLQYHVTVIENAEDLARWRAAEMAKITREREDDAAAIAAKAAAFESYLASEKVAKDKLKADLWTAAFFWPVAAGNADRLVAPTDGELQGINRGETPNPALVQGVQALAQRHNFFHWSTEFPHIYLRVYLRGGFDVILSNPPWERIKLQEKEWFAARDPAIADAPNAAARRKLIAALEQSNPTLYADFEADKHGAESESHFVRAGARYPLCGRGDVNTYAIFAELAYQMVHPAGRAGVIVPTGIATDDTTKFYFQEITEQGVLASLYDFENRRKLFPAVDSRMKFALLTLTGTDRPVKAAEFVFFALDVADLKEGERRFTLTAEEIALLNPNTRTVPLFRSHKDSELTKRLYSKTGVLVDEVNNVNEWMIRLTTMFHSSGAADLFHMASDLTESLRYGSQQPLYEARMFHQYNHRFATYDFGGRTIHDTSTSNLADPLFRISGRVWVDTSEVQDFYNRTNTKSYMIAFRKIARSTDERTGIFSVLPKVGALDSVHLILLQQQPKAIAAFLSNANAFVLDYVLRQTLGGANFNFFVAKQLPFLGPSIYDCDCSWDLDANPLKAWLLPRVLELTYTAWDLQPFAQDCGYDGPPFRWDEERRFLLRCELDAAYFHLYGIARDDVDYIMETFPIVKRKDVAKFGDYRTKRTILEIYDEMAAAMRESPGRGVPYQTRLDPPPADPRVAHSPRVIEAQR